MSDQEKVFADGFIFKRNPKAPEFVIGRVSIKVNEAISFLKSVERNDWVNLDVKQARSGNYYMELDTYEAPKKDGDAAKSSGNVNRKDEEPRDIEHAEDELPF